MIDKNGEYVNTRVRMSWAQDAARATISTFPKLVAQVRESLRGCDLPDDDRAVYRWMRDAFWAYEDRRLIDYMIRMRDFLAARADLQALERRAAEAGMFLADRWSPSRARA